MKEMLYKKYRPQDFDNFYGNRHVVKTIKNSIVNGRVSHAYLFSGSRGTGKTSLARLIAKSLNCLSPKDGYNPCAQCSNCLSISGGKFPDMVEMDAASNRGIEEIRALKDSVNYRPIVGKYKIYIVDEVHMLTKEAFNALLKTLEEPPRHVIFILATTEPEKIPDTIHSRCQRHDLKLLDSESMIERLLYVIDSEGFKLDERSIELIVRESGSSMRDALSLLEKILSSYSDKDISYKDTESALGLVPTSFVDEVYDFYRSGDLKMLVNKIDQSWRDGYKIESLLKGLAMKIKDEAVRGSIEFHRGVADISIIYESINDFRLEENKRAVGYLIAYKLIKNREPSEKIVEDLTKNNTSIDIPVKEVKGKKEAIEEVGRKRETIKETIKEAEKREITENIESREEVKKIEDVKKEVKEKFKREDVEEKEVKEKEVKEKFKREDVEEKEIKEKEVKKIEDVNEEVVNKKRVQPILSQSVPSESSTEEIDSEKIFSDIKDSWSEILQLVKEKKLSLMLFLSGAKPTSMEGNVLTLEYSKEYSFHKTSLEKRANLIVLEEIIGKRLGLLISIKLEYSSDVERDLTFSDRVNDFLKEEQG